MVFKPHRVLVLHNLNQKTFKCLHSAMADKIHDGSEATVPLQIETTQLGQNEKVRQAASDEFGSDSSISLDSAHGFAQEPDYGASDKYGKRLNYQEKKCRNPICFFLYYAQTFTLIGFTIYLCAYLIPQHLESQNNTPSNNNNLVHLTHTNQFDTNNPILHQYNNLNLATETEPDEDEFSFLGLSVAIISAAATALIFGFVWYIIRCSKTLNTNNNILGSSFWTFLPVQLLN